MKVAYLCATDPVARKYSFVDSRDWATTKDKGEPPATRRPLFDADEKVVDFEGDPAPIDRQEGFYYNVVIQGVGFSTDHISVEHKDAEGRVVICGWNNDTGDYNNDEFEAHVWTFTRMPEDGIPAGCQRKIWYMSDSRKADLEAKGILPQTIADGERVFMTPDGRTVLRREFINPVPVEVRPYADFTLPPASLTRHGIWVLDTLHRNLHSISRPSHEDWLGDPV